MMMTDRALKKIIAEALDANASAGAQDEIEQWSKAVYDIAHALNGAYRDLAQDGDLDREQIKQLKILEGRAEMLLRTVKRVIAEDSASGAE